VFLHFSDFDDPRTIHLLAAQEEFYKSSQQANPRWYWACQPACSMLKKKKNCWSVAGDAQHTRQLILLLLQIDVHHVC
jgi:hypothetical protein